MPTFQLIEIFTRIGLALAAGVLIFIIPIAIRKGHFAATQTGRVVAYLIALLATLAFIAYSLFLWNRFVPDTPDSDTPPPVTYPAPPPAP